MIGYVVASLLVVDALLIAIAASKLMGWWPR